MKIDLTRQDRFEKRHNGPSAGEIEQMLEVVKAESVDALIEQTVPKGIRMQKPLDLPAAQSEATFLKSFRKLAAKNEVFRSYIGMGYYDTYTPSVILRNVLENPGWYTAYTPYQAEIAQGRLEMLINFQTMVTDLTGMELANASLLDEGTAAAEAMTMLHAASKRKKKGANVFLVDENVHPQTQALLETRATPVGIELRYAQPEAFEVTDAEVFGMLLQYPGSDGKVTDFTALIEAGNEQNVRTVVAADLLSLAVLKAPGKMGADVVVGSAQRFGVPMGYGGPHAAFLATKDGYKRMIPGRIIGVSKDKDGNPAYRMALQTREQHIKREKATSNICTAQVLLAVMAGAYGVYHGPEGLRQIAERTHGMAVLLAKALKKLGFTLTHEAFFDTLRIEGADAEKVKSVAEERQINLRYFADGAIGASMDETVSVEDVAELAHVFAEAAGKSNGMDVRAMAQDVESVLPASLERQSDYLTHPTFHKYRSEHEMLRYLKRLENKDVSLTHSMISLGSCTMKLNATTEMIPVTWPEFGGLHPFAPKAQAAGYTELFANLEKWLSEATGFHAVSLQPNSGAQGEYTGLMTIRAYHEARGEGHRNVTIVPTSAHGTNPASAVMAGQKVVLVACDAQGNVDLDDLRAKAEQHSANLSGLMVTYPSTHGVFEEDIREICGIVHEHGGRVYMDGANMNAQVGLTSPALIGADVCHLNLHKTFCIPHGGGGPGMGPIGVVEDLAPYLPQHPLIETGGAEGIGPVSAAPFGSASILTISYAYIAMMGGDGLTEATKIAILNSNYIKDCLEGHYPILYLGKNGRAAHETIIDCRGFKKFGIEVEDIAKRLMDYGYHAPTVSFPVAGTMMIEPTESETKAEIDRFINAMVAIREEIREIEEGLADKADNVLKNAPHTAELVMADEWAFPYSREKAAYPIPCVKDNKFWPSVRRIDSAYGDRNLMCSCIPVESYSEEAAEEVETAV